MIHKCLLACFTYLKNSQICCYFVHIPGIKAGLPRNTDSDPFSLMQYYMVLSKSLSIEIIIKLCNTILC